MSRSIATFSKLAAAAALMLVAGNAAAQASASAVSPPRIIVDRFDPPPPSDLFFSVSEAPVFADLRVDAAVVFSYAHSPLVLYREVNGMKTSHLGDIVQDSAILHILGSVQLFKRVIFDIDAPGALLSSGPGNPYGFSIAKGPAWEDIRLGTRVELLPQHGHWPAASLRLSLFIPTGNAADYTGMGFVRFTPELVVGTNTSRYAWTAMLGREFQPESTLAPNIVNGGQMTAGLAGAIKLAPVAITLEAFGATVDDRGAPAFNPRTTNLEALLGIKGDYGPFTFGAAGGPGLVAGVGNPEYRLIASVGYHWAPAPPPPPPPVVEKPEPPPPPPVVIVEAPKKPPPPPPKPELDSDGDGIPDAIDACPHEKGEATQDPKTNGCPPPAAVIGDQIVIMQQIEFATGSDVIQPQSFHILETVAKIMAEHPDIARLSIDGHTDSVGSVASNVLLSQRRALSVNRWLLAHGLDARRTEARGFGPKRPIASNLTAEGKQKNRRVEFLIKKRTPLGEKGWVDGPVESDAKGGKKEETLE